MTLKENYSIPERCLGMRDMLKKFKGKRGLFSCQLLVHLASGPLRHALGHRKVFPISSVQLVPVCVLMSSGWFHGVETFLILVLGGL